MPKDTDVQWSLAITMIITFGTIAIGGWVTTTAGCNRITTNGLSITAATIMTITELR